MSVSKNPSQPNSESSEELPALPRPGLRGGCTHPEGLANSTRENGTGWCGILERIVVVTEGKCTETHESCGFHERI